MDIACRTRNVPLLRRLEQCAPYAGWLLVKVPQFAGLGSAWQRRWVVVCHRFPSPTAATQLTHCVFLAYKKLDSSRPASCLWLDGAKAVSHPPPAAARAPAAPACASAAASQPARFTRARRSVALRGCT